MNKKRILILLSIIITGIVIAIFAAKATIERNMKQLAASEVSDVELSSIQDGVYNGSYSVFPDSATVSVTVKDHAIKEIKLVKHVSGQGAPAEVIPSRVVEAQSLKVDIVSGATYSSKIILKAIENALISSSSK